MAQRIESIEVSEAIDRYLKSSEICGLARRTRDHYAQCLGKFKDWAEHSHNTILNRDTEDLMPKFCEHMRQKRRSGTSIQQYVTIIKMLMRWLGLPMTYTYRLPSVDKKAQQVKSTERWFNEIEVKMCSEYEFSKVRDHKVKIRNKLLVQLLIDTGARIHELANIRGKDFDTANNTVFLGTSKTQIRPVFYSEKTAAMVQELHDIMCIVFDDDWEHRIFPDTVYCKQIITDMLDDLGIKKNRDGRGPHTFRHYVATYLYYVGNMNLEDLAIFLGDKPETIRVNYLHPTPEMLRRRVSSAMGWKN